MGPCGFDLGLDFPCVNDLMDALASDSELSANDVHGESFGSEFGDLFDCFF